ncbi:Gmad2 immunoglobulin-like domain-containing protein [Micromonospora robiginosa]|uniref:Gmad2 immunoglobulin-like domain-containing protein n=1 Tax=Micromonospora robiginosa TaxID=2749844 RepID=A0A7L6B293_9ACTN|nr:Gmad2 immunoglobulin-like domain-containing protein [Micromonospora ferruginea]QLQ36092.1 Gmad2 immunoglobulin-like domain-containing protein [Micromonospora ferruginea]
MRRLIPPLAALLLVAGGCAPPRTGSLGPAPVAPSTSATVPAGAGPSTGAPVPASPSSRAATAGTPTGSGTPAAASREPVGTVSVQLWFVRAGRLAPTRRALPATVATSHLALDALAAGPSAAESATGLTTLVPAGTRVTRIADGVATLVPPAGFDAGGTVAARTRRAQVVWTLTQFPTVRRVAFAPAGAATGRDDYADLLPAIVVTAPVIGEHVGSPVTVTGTADVYEATVSARVLDAAGRQVGAAFTTASCGSGCRGAYRLTVRYRGVAPGGGVVEVFQVSARDGSRMDVVRVPVTLTSTG